MFLGEYAHSLDNKGRLTLPVKYREPLEQGLVITRSLVDKCLCIFPMSEWEGISVKVRALSISDPRSAQLRRVFFGAAEDLIPDKQGRILVSQRLREFAALETDVVITGADSYFEIWNPTLWETKVLHPLVSGEIASDFFAELNI